MSQEPGERRWRPARFARRLQVVLSDIDHPEVPISSVSHSVNVSRNGLLMWLPEHLNGGEGQEVHVTISWDGGRFETAGVIVRFKSPVDAALTRAGGMAEREAALAMLDRRRRRAQRITLAGDKAFDVRSFIEDLRQRAVTPHIAIDGNVREGDRRRP